MKKRILSLVLCAAMLLSMCLFLGAGVMDDASSRVISCLSFFFLSVPKMLLRLCTRP